MRKKKISSDSPVDELLTFLLTIGFLAAAGGLYFNHKFSLYSGLGILGFLLLLVVLYVIFSHKQRQYCDQVYEVTETDIQNFIHRNGRTKDGEKFGKYKISSNAIEVLRTELEKRYKIQISDKVMHELLCRFVKDEEAQLILHNTFGSEAQNLDKLSGTEFEILLTRLFTAQGYVVEHNGGSGDQGADLILNKSGIRIAVQAKRYAEPVNNKAVQEVYAAKAIHDCEHARVITTSTFTQGAYQNAEANSVELIDGAHLKKMLNDHLKEIWL